MFGVPLEVSSQAAYMALQQFDAANRWQTTVEEVRFVNVDPQATAAMSLIFRRLLQGGSTMQSLHLLAGSQDLSGSLSGSRELAVSKDLTRSGDLTESRRSADMTRSRDWTRSGDLSRSKDLAQSREFSDLEGHRSWRPVETTEVEQLWKTSSSVDELESHGTLGDTNRSHPGEVYPPGGAGFDTLVSQQVAQWAIPVNTSLMDSEDFSQPPPRPVTRQDVETWNDFFEEPNRQANGAASAPPGFKDTHLRRSYGSSHSSPKNSVELFRNNDLNDTEVLNSARSTRDKLNSARSEKSGRMTPDTSRSAKVNSSRSVKSHRSDKNPSKSEKGTPRSERGTPRSERGTPRLDKTGTPRTHRSSTPDSARSSKSRSLRETSSLDLRTGKGRIAASLWSTEDFDRDTPRNISPGSSRSLRASRKSALVTGSFDVRDDVEENLTDTNRTHDDNDDDGYGDDEDDSPTGQPHNGQSSPRDDATSMWSEAPANHATPNDPASTDAYLEDDPDPQEDPDDPDQEDQEDPEADPDSENYTNEPDPKDQDDQNPEDDSDPEDNANNNAEETRTLKQPITGRMLFEVTRKISLAGYEEVGTIVIKYNFPSGKIQASYA